MRWRRVYTKKSHKLMLRVRLLILIITSPLWMPLQIISFVGYAIEDVLDLLDDLLQKVLDKVIPQIK